MLHAIVDDAAVRNSLAALLQAHGIPVNLYSSEAEFLHNAPTPTTGCLLIDVRSHSIEGIELLGRLRNKGIGIPAMIMVDRASPGQSAPSAGARIVQKPAGPNDILDNVVRMLAGG